MIREVDIVPVREELPELLEDTDGGDPFWKSERVLGWDSQGKLYCCCRCKSWDPPGPERKLFWDHDNGDGQSAWVEIPVTHWMALPPAP